MVFPLWVLTTQTELPERGMRAVRRGALGSIGTLSDWVQSPLRRLGLHQRIALFVGGIVVALFAAFAYLGWEAISRSTEEALTQRTATAGILAIHVDDLLEDAQDHLVGISAEVASLGREPRADTAGLVLDQSQVHMHDYFSEVLVLDVQGNLVSSRPPLASLTASPDLRELAGQALRTKGAVASNVVHLPVSQAVGVMLAAPIVTADQKVVGFTVGEMQLPHRAFNEFTSAEQVGDSGQVELVDGNGKVLVASNGADPGSDAAHIDFYRPYLGQSASQGMQTGRDGGPDPFMVTLAPLQRAPWAIGIAQSESEMFAATQRLRDQTAAAAAVALMLTLCLAWIGTQSVVAPILALQRAGQRMATGDLSEPIRADHRDELGSLARVLETMRQRLRTSLAETQALNRSLEQRVRARTQALQTSNQALEASNRRLRALMAVATVANAGGDVQQVLETSLKELVETAGGRGAWALVNDADGGLRLAASRGLSKRPGDELPVVIEDPPSCLRSFDGACLPCPSSHRCPVLAARSPDASQLCWTAPFHAGPQTYGVLCLAEDHERPLDPETSALMEGIAQQVASAFQASRLMEERTHLEAERRVSMLRGELLASVSHELRTPLGFIKGYAGTLLRDDVVWDETQQKSFLEIIDHESDQLANLVESLLEAARVQAGRLQLNCSTVDPEEIVRRAVDRISSSLTRHDIRVDVGQVPAITADGGRLEQVGLNLLQNAAKYSPDGGPIDVQLDSDPEGVHLAVLDRGLGISAADAQRIFEPFYRAQSGDPTIGGAGLGLAVCRAIVEAHGGRIWAEPRDGGGTAVHVVLPRAESVAA